MYNDTTRLTTITTTNGNAAITMPGVSLLCCPWVISAGSKLLAVDARSRNGGSSIRRIRSNRDRSETFTCALCRTFPLAKATTGRMPA